MNIDVTNLDNETVLTLLRADLLTNAFSRRADVLTPEEKDQFSRLDKQLWSEYDRRRLNPNPQDHRGRPKKPRELPAPQTKTLEELIEWANGVLPTNPARNQVPPTDGNGTENRPPETAVESTEKDPEI